MAVSPCQEQVQGQDAYEIYVVPDKELANTQHLACLNFKETPELVQNTECMDPRWDFKNCTILQIGNLDGYSPSDVDIGVKKELLETHRTDDRPIKSLIRSDSSLSRTPRRKISLEIGEKFMQLFMNPNNMLEKSNSGDKLATERAPDTPNSRWRRYKRAASFDPRRIVLVFSILSSFGTLVLIYLTLRVKQMDDGPTHA